MPVSKTTEIKRHIRYCHPVLLCFRHVLGIGLIGRRVSFYWLPEGREDMSITDQLRNCHVRFLHSIIEINYFHVSEIKWPILRMFVLIWMHFFLDKFKSGNGKINPWLKKAGNILTEVCMHLISVWRRLKLDSNSNTERVFIALSHAHFRFWGHDRPSNRSISKRYPRSDAAPWVGKKFNFKSVSRSWHRIPLVVRKRWVWIETLMVTA